MRVRSIRSRSTRRRQKRHLALDSPETILHRARILDTKPFLKAVYRRWYAILLESLGPRIAGPVVEIGSGGGFLKDFLPGLITSEIVQIPGVDIVLDGQRLPFRKGSVRGIVMIDVFHHLSQVDRFFSEAADCVISGGIIAMIEPWVTSWSRLIYTCFHHEPFDPDTESWRFESTGPLSGANSALPWIVFERDRETFTRRFPQWQINRIGLHSPFAYLLSGGFSFRSPVPAALSAAVFGIENRLTRWMDRLAMFAEIVLLKK